MIRAEFSKQGGSLIGFSVKGHALFDEYGHDIVCAAVSSAVQLTVNAISEVIKQKPLIKAEQNHISLKLVKESNQASDFLKALELHISLLAQDYPDSIQITILEV